jgi:8-oxo-dGTP pyrophosphatase MutT (NUDIX family)
LFVTSCDTGKWIIPKGNVKPGTSPAKAAAQEALEEAGVKGIIVSSTPLGMYTCFKQLRSGEVTASPLWLISPASRTMS